MEADYIGGRAKSIKDLSNIGFDCGYYQNAVGNFSLIPYGDLYRLFPVIREKKRLKPQPSIAQALDFRR